MNWETIEIYLPAIPSLIGIGIYLIISLFIIIYVTYKEEVERDPMIDYIVENWPIFKQWWYNANLVDEVKRVFKR